ncbi:MAG: alkaline phosphatase family protein [Alphaproteobacteria bacterium]|nr:alkaline phosphatase family protein [Alphaproteobacteria bacterium]
MRAFLVLLLAVCLTASAAMASPVLMISIDGLRPADVIDAKKRGFAVPNLQKFLKDGAYATGVRNVLPTVTYPNHTTLITGVSPAVHGIANNTTFDPLGRNQDGWYWYASDIRVPTLWDAVHARHGIVASISWPVSVGTYSIDYNIPEYWRAQTPDDLKLLRALSTPGLVARLEKDSGMPLAALFGSNVDNDLGRTRYAERLLEISFPAFMTVHLVSLDHTQHEHGPGSPEAHAVLAQLDSDVGELVADARRIQPDIAVAIVSDHGFAPVNYEVNLGRAFVDAGLVTLEADRRRVVAWDAMPWNAGGSAAIVLAHPDDPVVRARVQQLLAKLAADPSSGVSRIIDRTGIDAMGGAREPSFWVDFRAGYYAGASFTGPLVVAGKLKGDHGYFPDDKEMRAAFMIEGPHIKPKVLGEIDMRDIAPTLAKILDVPFPSAQGKPLF